MKKDSLLKVLLHAQKLEATHLNVYEFLEKKENDPQNQIILQKLKNNEQEHYKLFKSVTKKDCKPSKFSIFFYKAITNIFGITFGIKLMEKSDAQFSKYLPDIKKSYPELYSAYCNEKHDEYELINTFNEERLQYIGSTVLGLNDALIELTGVLSGLSLALQKPQLIAIIGLITGISASFSMAASEYLSVTSEKDNDQNTLNPIKASVYTGLAYIVTVLILILPFFIFTNVVYSLSIMFFSVIGIILFFTYYTSIAQDAPFKKRFFEMVFLSMGVALLSFALGYAIKRIFGIDV